MNKIINTIFKTFVPIVPGLISAFKDKGNYKELNTLFTTYPALGLAAMSLMTLPQEPTSRDWIVTAGLVIIGCAGFVIRNNRVIVK